MNPEEKAADHPEEVCKWFIGISGGEEVSFTCDVDDVTHYITTSTQKRCESGLELDEK